MLPWLQIVSGGARVWKFFEPVKRVRKRRLVKKYMKQGKAKEEAQIMAENTISAHGWKTYAGIATIVLGVAFSWMGIGDCIPDAAGACQSAGDIVSNLSGAVTKILEGGGVILATIGAVHKAIKIKKLQNGG